MMLHSRNMELARTVAERSEDRSTKVGAVCVSFKGSILSCACNGFPDGLTKYENRYHKPNKYIFTEHAERNAIYRAARSGVQLEAAAMYVTLLPCVECARAIVQAGIRTVVVPSLVIADKWAESTKNAKNILSECGVELIVLENGDAQ